MATSLALHAQLLSAVGDDARSQVTLWISSILLGILACKTIYNVMKAVSPLSAQYTRLSKPEKIEWDNRGFSTAHSIAISTAAIYFIFISDLFKDDAPYGPVVFRSSMSSKIILGMSIGYFISDLSMILWFYPALGGKEYIVHHGLSVASLALSLYSGAGVFYVYLMLLSESTTPFVNVRWYLSVTGMKNSSAYIINGIFLFLGWMVILLLSNCVYTFAEEVPCTQFGVLGAGDSDPGEGGWQVGLGIRQLHPPTAPTWVCSTSDAEAQYGERRKWALVLQGKGLKLCAWACAPACVLSKQQCLARHKHIFT